VPFVNNPGSRQRILAATSASSERSPFCSSMCAAMGRDRNLLTV